MHCPTVHSSSCASSCSAVVAKEASDVSSLKLTGGSCRAQKGSLFDARECLVTAAPLLHNVEENVKLLEKVPSLKEAWTSLLMDCLPDCGDGPLQACPLPHACALPFALSAFCASTYCRLATFCCPCAKRCWAFAVPTALAARTAHAHALLHSAACTQTDN